ncbi:MAG: alpha-1,6-glucosidase domain-containing protein [Candidatus Krumholzibacteriia bacterium]
MRIREMKEMIQAFHTAGIKVVMDVVYNHTHNTGPAGSLYDAMVPKYYYRLLADGSYSNGSGVGNEVATEKLMARRFIKQSCRYWVEEFHIDGFRFDLMGLMDTDIMAEITDEVKAINPAAIIYGEPWGGYGGQILTGKGDQRGLGFGCFNDNIRNGIRGSTDGTDPGYAMNDVNDRNAVVRGIEGSINDFTDGPTETINYISAHDNYTWWDKLDWRWNPTNPPPGYSEDALIRMDRFGISMVLTAQGIPFLHAGSEFLRTKRVGDPEHPSNDEESIRNSYNAGDDVNQLDWARRAEYDQVVEYYKGLIALRLARPELRLTTKADIQASLDFLTDTGSAIAYRLADNTPRDDWGELLVVHNPSHLATSITLPAGQWAQVVDADHAGTATITTYLSPSVSPASLEVPARSTAVLYQQVAPPIQLNLFQNPVLDRYLHLAVNVRDGVDGVLVTINGAAVALADQGGGSYFGSHVLDASGELVITVDAVTAQLTHRVTAWALDGGAEGRSVDGRLTVSVPDGARPGGWLVISGSGPWLLGAEGARLDRPAVLRAEVADRDQVFEVLVDGQWRTLPTVQTADGKLEASTEMLGRIRLAPGRQVPEATRLLGNAPNPFNPATEIRRAVGGRRRLAGHPRGLRRARQARAHAGRRPAHRRRPQRRLGRPRPHRTSGRLGRLHLPPRNPPAGPQRPHAAAEVGGRHEQAHHPRARRIAGPGGRLRQRRRRAQEPQRPSDQQVLTAGWAAFDAADYPEAETQFRILLGRGALVAQAHDGLGWTFARQSEPDSAVVHYAAALAGGADGLDIADQTHAGHAFALNALGEYADAVTAAAAVSSGWVFARDPEIDHDDVVLTLAVAHYALGEFAESLSAVQQLDPGFLADVETVEGRAELAARIEQLLG